MDRLSEVRVPDMGNFKDVAVVDVLVKPGDSIEIDTPLVTLETEKATMDVPSTASGIVEQIAVKKGGHVSPGDLVVTVRAGDSQERAAANEAVASSPAKAPEPPAPKPEATSAQAAAAPPRPAPPDASPSVANGKSATPATAPLATIDEPGFSRAHASPSVRRFARELGVDLAAVQGTGFKSRITQDDVKGFVKRELSGQAGTAGAPKAPAAAAARLATPAVDFTQFGPTETKPLTRIQRVSGTRLHASWTTIPHVTQFDEADITELEKTRSELKQKATEQGIKLTPLAFIMRACVKALQEFPQFNASLDASGDKLILKKYLHLGFAADTPNGLLVPVVRDADRRDIYEIARCLGELSEKARAGKLSLDEMQGGCFTISSLGGIGGTAFTPIINAPEVAILGVSRSVMRPVFADGAFVPRLMLPLSLSYDHRVIDGALAARFTTFLAQTLADVRGLLEAVP